MTKEDLIEQQNYFDISIKASEIYVERGLKANNLVEKDNYCFLASKCLKEAMKAQEKINLLNKLDQ